MKMITEKILPDVIKKRRTDSFKSNYGKVALIGGNENFGGAIIMSTLGAVYAGAGLTTTITALSNQTSLHSWIPEAMFLDYSNINETNKLVNKMDVITIGSGLGTDENSLKVLKNVLENVEPQQTLIIDGSAIDLIATYNLQLPNVKLILTPHQMEWQKISNVKIKDQTEKNNQLAYHNLAQNHELILVLKSEHTHTYYQNDVYLNTTGTPAQATGGMGDTLAGIIAGFVAQFGYSEKVINAAVFSHSKIATDLAENQYVVLPHQISQKLPEFMKKNEK
ncbi:NAD(P)H-hydrate dehydratase [Fructilactobacillus vespulae]|uniref:NAD(P)H-hydrate dehydratase n=1 Tax=Fructilactobacillus vespulae TaxID=1249630 RepID=UPI0039B65511